MYLGKMEKGKKWMDGIEESVRGWMNAKEGKQKTKLCNL